jgi:hypothetical protein
MLDYRSKRLADYLDVTLFDFRAKLHECEMILIVFFLKNILFVSSLKF